MVDGGAGLGASGTPGLGGGGAVGGTGSQSFNNHQQHMHHHFSRDEMGGGEGPYKGSMPEMQPQPAFEQSCEYHQSNTDLWKAILQSKGKQQSNSSNNDSNRNSFIAMN